MNWHDSSLIHWWCARNRSHRRILNQDCSFKQFASSISSNLLQHDLAHNNWNKRFRQHSFAYDSWWYDEKKWKVETYKSIEKKMKRIVLMYEHELFCRFSESFLSHKFLASLYNDYLHRWNMFWFLSASLKISKNYRIWFIIEKRFCQAMRLSFLINFETFLNIRDERCIVET